MAKRRITKQSELMSAQKSYGRVRKPRAEGDSESRLYKPALWLRRGKADCEELRMDSEDQGRPTLSATCAISRPNRESEPKTALAGALPS